MVESPYADWLSVRFCSSSSSPKDTEGWLLEREKREKRMPPMPFPILAAPTSSAGGRGREKGKICWVGCGSEQKKKNGSNILCILCNPISKNYFEVGEAMQMSPFSICPHDGTVDTVL